MDASTEQAASAVINAGLIVHRALGPGLLESVYETCLHHELKALGLAVQRQVEVPIAYRGVLLTSGLRLDLVVADRVVVEVKATNVLAPIHSAQLMTYLRLSKLRLGLLLNFNVVLFRQGIRRIVM